MQPNTYEDWIEVYRERQADADALLYRSKSAGSVYMAGYAVEASLKAFLRKLNFEFPKSGPGGHNLLNLWKQAGFRISDLKDEKGEKAYFLEEWSTDLRYEVSPNIGHDHKSLVDAAGRLAGWIQKQLARKSRNRRKK